MSNSQIQKRPQKRSRVSHNTRCESREMSAGPSLTSRSHASENSPETDMPDDDDDDYEAIDLEKEDLDLANDVARKEVEEIRRNCIIETTKKKKKEYWDYYLRFLDKDNKMKAECIHCKKANAADSKVNGTKNLKQHWLDCEDNPANKSKGTQPQLVLEKVDNNCVKLKSWVLNHKVCRAAVAKMIILDELPFRHMEKLGFKLLMATSCPTFNVHSSRIVARDCYDLYLHEKLVLKGALSKSCQRVSLTTDSWTSCQRINYMSITAHYIDDEWKLQKRILNFCQIVSHKGDYIGRGIEDCLRAWDVCDKVFTVTVDNASNNDTTLDWLKDMARINGICINNADNMHMRCVAHIANLIVSDGLKLHVACIDKVRVFVKHWRSSPSRLHLFGSEAEKLKIQCNSSLTLDVPTRWNSTYMMLDVALKYKSVFARLDTPRKGNGECLEHITREEWNKVEVIVNFLKEFYDFTKDVSGSSYVTVSNVFFYIGNLVIVLNKWLESNDEDCKAMAFDMKLKCDKYWGSIEKMNMLIFVAIILNPVYKFIMLEVSLVEVYGSKGGELAKKVKDFANELFEQYKGIYGSSMSHDQANDDSARPSTQVKKGGGSANEFMKNLEENVSAIDESDGEVFNEFDRYLHELRVPKSDQIDILAWWKLNAPRFPIVAHMARDVLAIPVTTVPSESAFSTGGRTLDQFRSCLTPKTAQGLICTQDWLRAKAMADKDNDIEEEDSLEVFKKIEEDVESTTSTLSSLSVVDKEVFYF